MSHITAMTIQVPLQNILNNKIKFREHRGLIEKAKTLLKKVKDRKEGGEDLIELHNQMVDIKNEAETILKKEILS